MCPYQEAYWWRWYMHMPPSLRSLMEVAELIEHIFRPHPLDFPIQCTEVNNCQTYLMAVKWRESTSLV